MKGRDWIKWTVNLTDARHRELFFAWMNDLSPRGLWEIDPCTIVAYFDTQPEEGVIPDWMGSVQREIEPDQPWAESWRARFGSIRVGRQVLVRPPWEEAVPETLDVVIYPAYAFGTGDHSTTALCLECLEQYLRPGMDVLDVGSGSGILAILAVRLQAGKIVALDNDPLAIAEISRNMALNGLEPDRIEVLSEELAALSGSFHLIVSNIGFRYHCDHLDQMISYLEPGGRLIMSGFEDTEAESLIQRVQKTGLVEETRHSASGWSCLVYNKQQRVDPCQRAQAIPGE